MLRATLVSRQLPRQLLTSSMGYSSAFVDRNEHPVSDYHTAMSLYSPAAHNLPRRKGHTERQAKYRAKMRLVNSMARERIGKVP